MEGSVLPGRWSEDKGVVHRLQVFQIRDIPNNGLTFSSFLPLLITMVTTNNLRTIPRGGWVGRVGNMILRVIAVTFNIHFSVIVLYTIFIK